MKKTKVDHYTDKEALEFHSHKKPGKIEIVASKNMTTKRDLALAYSPGVAVPVKKISENPDAAYDYTSKGNLVAVISNGSLGNQREGQGDEKKINPSPPEPTQSIPWKPENVEKIWRVVIDQLESMTESLARMVERVEHAGPNRAKLHLSPDASLAKRRLDSTEHREAIMSSLKQLTGDTIHFDVILQRSSTQKIEPKPSVSKPSRMQRMREIENHQLIKDCLEVFDAEIVGIDKPR